VDTFESTNLEYSLVFFNIVLLIIFASVSSALISLLIHVQHFIVTVFINFFIL
jgi:hypothetical protein